MSILGFLLGEKGIGVYIKGIVIWNFVFWEFSFNEYRGV